MAEHIGLHAGGFSLAGAYPDFPLELVGIAKQRQPFGRLAENAVAEFRSVGDVERIQGIPDGLYGNADGFGRGIVYVLEVFLAGVEGEVQVGLEGGEGLHEAGAAEDAAGDSAQFHPYLFATLFEYGPITPINTPGELMLLGFANAGEPAFHAVVVIGNLPNLAKERIALGSEQMQGIGLLQNGQHSLVGVSHLHPGAGTVPPVMNQVHGLEACRSRCVDFRMELIAVGANAPPVRVRRRLLCRRGRAAGKQHGSGQQYQQLSHKDYLDVTIASPFATLRSRRPELDGLL